MTIEQFDEVSTQLPAADDFLPTRRRTKTLRIAMIGTRGVPAAYGGFETAVEEVGVRLAERGHDITVYTRGSASREQEYRGMKVVHLPAMPIKQAETLSHTGLSTLHAFFHRKFDAAFVFNAANSPFVPLLHLRGIPVALHMDGLEWRRSKWGPRGRAYYRWAEEFGVRTADALIADAPGIADYYDDQFGVPTEMIRYGAPILEMAPAQGVRALGFEPGGYHLVVARFEPENHVLEIVQGYRNSSATKPLVVVGSAPYSAEYTQRIAAIVESDPRIHLLGAVYDQGLLDALYYHAYTYVHGHSVGGTNPSLLRAMGAGTAVIAYDVGFNRETLAENAWFFADARELAPHFGGVEASPAEVGRLGAVGRDRAATTFTWDEVSRAYEDLAARLHRGQTLRAARPAPRRRSGEWAGFTPGSYSSTGSGASRPSSSAAGAD